MPSLALMILLFLSTPSARRATHSFQCGHPAFQFLSTPSARRATSRGRGSGSGRKISIHALREEGDYAMIWQEWFRDQFLSTPSARRATPASQTSGRHSGNFYPRPPRGGRRRRRRHNALRKNFYPRPPRGGRLVPSGILEQLHIISIHALREEGDSTDALRLFLSMLFLSTPSARRATPSGRSCPAYRCDFYPRPPRGGRLL